MNRRSLFVLFSLLSAFAYAQEWIPLSGTDELSWEGLTQSREIVTNKGGKQVYVLIGRVVNKKTKAITPEKWYVTTDDCENGMGKIVTLDMSGNYKYENDFLIGSGNVASSLAGMLCYEVTKRKKENAAKSL
jgi:hypothetical protein